MAFSDDRLGIQLNPNFIPRWYQDESVNAMFNYFYNGGKGNPLIVAPTGAGKSHIIGLFCKRVLERWPTQQILILSHVDTILRQDYLSICEHVPQSKVGMYSAGIGLKERRSITVGGIQSIHTKYALFHKTTMIIIDEAHTVPRTGEGQYRKFLKQFDCPIIGLTATHFRLGTGYLHEGSGRIFTDIAYDIDINRLIDEGFLTRLVPREPSVTVDMAGVHVQGGEFVRKEMVDRLDRDGLTEGIITDLIQYRDTYKKWLIFTIDIDHAELVTALLNQHGIVTAVVHSKQARGLREALKKDYIEGRYQALVSVETLTTGFDVPSIDLIGLLRPTDSPGLHVQMIGRGLRIAKGKDHCLVLDYAGNVARLGPINDVRIRVRKGKKGGPPITKTCPECQTIVAGVTKFCPECGYEFTFKSKLEDEASNRELVTKKKAKKVIKPAWYTVDSVAYRIHKGNYGDTLAVSYRCGLRTFTEHKKFDINSKAGYHSRHWWIFRQKDKNQIPPADIQEAFLRAIGESLYCPSSVLILEKTKYPEIQDYIF